jgi:hypothetical protein
MSLSDGPTKKPIELGDEVEDIVAKVKGIAHGRVEYLDGSVYWIVQPPADPDGNLTKDIHVQDAYCVRVGDGVRVEPKSQIGFHAREGNA